jgi:hypothetical protein
MQTDIHASNGIRIADPSVRVSEAAVIGKQCRTTCHTSVVNGEHFIGKYILTITHFYQISVFILAYNMSF